MYTSTDTIANYPASALQNRVPVAGVPTETDDVPGRGLQDDVLVLAEGRDLETDVQGHLHVPEEHDRGLSARCIDVTDPG